MENSKHKWYEWLVAYIVVLMAIGKLVFATYGLWAEWVPVYDKVFLALYAVVMIWAVWRLARGSKVSGLKYGVWMAYFCITVIAYLFSWTMPLIVQGSEDYITSTITTSISGVFNIVGLILAIIIIVELFKKKIKPLNILMLMTEALPLLIGLVQSIVIGILVRYEDSDSNVIPVIVAISTLLTSIVLALLFLHRNDLNKTTQDA